MLTPITHLCFALYIDSMPTYAIYQKPAKGDISNDLEWLEVLNPRFKVTPLFDTEYLRNDTR